VSLSSSDGSGRCSEKVTTSTPWARSASTSRTMKACEIAG
jgi:hypothetical protein